MSTIEKAAARLVKKRVAKEEHDKLVDVRAGVKVGLKADEAPFEEGAESVNGDRVAELPSSVEQTISRRPVVADVEDSILPNATRNQRVPQTESADVYVNSCELDFEMLAENGFLVPNHTNRQQNQEFRRIKRPLLQNMQPHISSAYSRPTNVIFVTSALPAEGKTFVSLNLALTLAGEVDRSVLLIDGDVAKGDLSRWMGIYEEPGLADLLSSRSDLTDSAIIQTNVDRLSVLSCGKQQENLDELYGSDLMLRVVDQLAQGVEDRIIVIDGPPLLPTTEAAVLAGLMGQTILVVEANETPQAAVENAVDQLKDNQLVSALLNKVVGSKLDGYGYGYGYGYGSSQDAQPPGIAGGAK